MTNVMQVGGPPVAARPEDGPGTPQHRATAVRGRGATAPSSRQAERRLITGEAWQANDLVLDAGDGWPLRTDSVSSGFAELIRMAGLPHVRFHDLRHAYATALLAGGVHRKIASEALEHTSVAFTMDVYSHVVLSM